MDKFHKYFLGTWWLDKKFRYVLERAMIESWKYFFTYYLTFSIETPSVRLKRVPYSCCDCLYHLEIIVSYHTYCTIFAFWYAETRYPFTVNWRLANQQSQALCTRIHKYHSRENLCPPWIVFSCFTTLKAIHLHRSVCGVVELKWCSKWAANEYDVCPLLIIRRISEKCL